MPQRFHRSCQREGFHCPRWVDLGGMSGAHQAALSLLSSAGKDRERK